MKYAYLIIAIILFGCSLNKEIVNYLKDCKERERDKLGFVLVKKDDIIYNLNLHDVLRYIGSNEKYHYFIHYYDKTVKIQSLFKFNEDINALKQHIDIQKNLFHKEKYGKYKDSYYITIKEFEQ